MDVSSYIKRRIKLQVFEKKCSIIYFEVGRIKDICSLGYYIMRNLVIYAGHLVLLRIVRWL
jgi:hypothetical protein